MRLGVPIAVQVDVVEPLGTRPGRLEDLAQLVLDLLALERLESPNLLFPLKLLLVLLLLRGVTGASAGGDDGCGTTCGRGGEGTRVGLNRGASSVGNRK